ELVDHRGNRVNQADFAGQWQLVFFGFTFCPDICPTTLATIAQVLDSLGARTDRLTPLFITVDPERDTPEVLAEYVAAFHPRIVGLTGTTEQVRAAARSFRIYHGRQADEYAPDGYVMSHSGYIYLMDTEGRYEAVFTEKRDSAEQIAAAINRRLGDD
ncbi:MAG: SCO family protein, partial [Alphaproteobacteria bacterium]